MIKPRYRDKKFKTKTAFEKWLRQTTKKIIHFEDKGQDFLRWYLDKEGEVLHCEPFQAGVWNSTIVLAGLAVGERPVIQNKWGDKYKLRYRITKVESPRKKS